MKINLWSGGCVLLAAVCWPSAAHEQTASPKLVIDFGSNGLQRLSFQGQVLEDLQRFPDDAFHIWHMKCSGRSGQTLPGGQCGWGENNDGRSWDLASRSWTYKFKWGTIRTQYVQHGDVLDVSITATNRADSGVVFDGATVYPLGLHLPRVPVGFVPGAAQLKDNVSRPGVTLADFGSGEVAAVVADAGKAVYSGFQPSSENGWTPIVSGTSPDALGPGRPRYDRPVLPGQVDRYTLSLRFAEAGTPAAQLGGDALASFASHYPERLNWKDRRIVGTVYLASSPQGDKTAPGGFANNPRRFFNDSSPAGFDVRDPAGLARFQARVLRQASSTVANLRRLNAQGVITWDIEGEEYPQDTSYVCSPDEIARAAPEMESVINDKASPYAGMKLDDAYFKTIRDAGFKVGVCVRPQHFSLGSDGRARQTSLKSADAAAELVRKMRYAHDRWGATLFYLDSTVEADGGTLDASVLEQAAAAMPDSLLIPEESTARMYRGMAPFMTFLFHGDTGTDPTIQRMYPHAFGVNLVNDVDATKLAEHRAELVEAVRRGDVLMVHADSWQANNAAVMRIYREAKLLTGREGQRR